MTAHAPIPAAPLDTPDTERRAFREGMARLAAAVNIITSDGPAGKAGFTATAVCSVSDNPPTLLVCLNRQASVYPAVTQNGVLCVNVLAAGQEGLSTLFGGKTPVEARFAATTWSDLGTGAPALDDALVSFDCRITSMTSSGSHDVLFCAVETIRHRAEGRGLVYFDRGYHSV